MKKRVKKKDKKKILKLPYEFYSLRKRTPVLFRVNCYKNIQGMVSFYSLEQTAHTSSLPFTYGGHFMEPHVASTR